MKAIIISVLLISFQTHAGLFDKPLPICSNIKSYLAYELSISVKGKCDAYIVINNNKLQKTFEGMLTNNEVSPGECRATCALLEASNVISMDSCIKNNIVKPFVTAFLGNGNFNDATCNEMNKRTLD